MDQRVIQVFCDNCSRGVMVWKESMYKCQKCGRQVCSSCFNRMVRQCSVCTRPDSGASEVQQSGIKAVIDERHKAHQRRRRRFELISALVTVVAIVGGAGLLAWLLATGRLHLSFSSLKFW